jgi:hypothetical protein
VNELSNVGKNIKKALSKKKSVDHVEDSDKSYVETIEDVENALVPNKEQ